MIFSYEINSDPSWWWVLQGSKTQTRRLVKPGDVELVRPEKNDHITFKRDGMYVAYPASETRTITQVTRKRRCQWKVGGVYAVQPTRTQPGLWWNPKTGVYAEAKSRFLPMTSEVVEPEDMPLIDHRPVLDMMGYIPLQIRVLSIRRQDVRDITHEDALAEGFESRHQFLSLWARQHDKTAFKPPDEDDYRSFTSRLHTRPLKFYDAWALEFERVNP